MIKINSCIACFYKCNSLLNYKLAEKRDVERKGPQNTTERRVTYEHTKHKVTQQRDVERKGPHNKKKRRTKRWQVF